MVRLCGRSTRIGKEGDWEKDLLLTKVEAFQSSAGSGPGFCLRGLGAVSARRSKVKGRKRKMGGDKERTQPSKV